MAENLLGFDRQYVFYKRLKEDASIKGNTNLSLLNQNVNSEIDKYIAASSGSHRNSVLGKIRAMAAVERTKEINLILAHLPSNTSSRPYIENLLNSGNLNEFVKAINMFMSTEEIFQRNIDRIQSEKNVGDIDLSAFLASYIDSSWRLHAGGFQQILSKATSYNDASNKIEDYFRTVIIPKALDAMLSSADFNGGDTHAYAEFIEVINNMRQTNNALYNIWVEDVLQLMGIKDLIKENLTIKNKKHGFNIPEGKLRGMHNQTKGKSQEYFSSLIDNALYLKNGQDLMNTVVGGQQIKTDTMVYEFSTKPLIDQIMNDTGLRAGVTFKEHVETFGKYTPKLKNSFLVFTNAKNYVESSEESNYKFGGFKAGVFTKNLEEYGQLFQSQGIGDRGRKIGALLQTIKGGYLDGDSERRQKVLTTVAEDFAYFLFDDWQMIGTADNQALHLFLLDGIYIPLSTLLNLLGDTIGNILNSPANYFNVSISGSVNSTIYNKPLGAFTIEDWQQQRAEALQNSSISATFMKNFFQLIRDSFKRK